MLKLSDALGKWQPSAGRWAGSDPVVLLGAVWAEIVGADVARNSHPLRVSGETLLIATRSSAWSQQLSLLSEAVIAAVAARVPSAGIRELRFRAGKLPAPQRALRPAPRARGEAPEPSPQRAPAGTAAEALERFKQGVTARQRAKRGAGWKECRGCGALIAPDGAAYCIACTNARIQERDGATARLLFEAPWLGYRGVAALVEGLGPADYEAIRFRLLARWWRTLESALRAKRLSRDGRERLIASSYVVLKSGLPPGEIRPATVRNVLGEELHELLYGTERQNESNVQ